MQKFAIPSREDAWDLNRREKTCVLFLMNVVSAFIDAKGDIGDRVKKIDGGEELLQKVCEMSIKLLEDVRTTIPERQRSNLNNTAHEYELRLVPKMTPGSTAVVVSKEEFRTLVDAAQAKCLECVDDCEEAKKCDLYKMLVVSLPMDKYDGIGLCPYNGAEWGN